MSEAITQAAAYDLIDRFLRNNLYDDDYAKYSEALEALSQPAPSPQPAVPVVPDGFSIVPVEPTQEMIVAAQCAYWPGMEVPNVHCITRALKAAMIAASQQKGGQHG